MAVNAPTTVTVQAAKVGCAATEELAILSDADGRTAAQVIQIAGVD